MKSPNTLHGISTIYHRRCGLSLSGVTSAYSTDGPLRRRARSAECRRPSEGAAYFTPVRHVEGFRAGLAAHNQPFADCYKQSCARERPEGIDPLAQGPVHLKCKLLKGT